MTVDAEGKNPYISPLVCPDCGYHYYAYENRPTELLCVTCEKRVEVS